MYKGQVSIEMMMVIAFILIFFIPVMAFSYMKIIELNEDLSTIQAQVAVSRIANTANSLGYMGPGSSLIIDIILPSNSNLKVQNVGSGSQVVLELELSKGKSEYVANSWFNINPFPLDLKSGVNYRLNITSTDPETVSVVLYN
ncbi:MAG: hypothetical protein WC501_04125 [Candidatus Micrarchaeia archaeon]|jgi:uncharacterized protein (UPF0333 family)